MKIEWHNTDPAKIEEVVGITTADLERLMEDLDGDPSKLVFHHVFLTRNYNGPCVFVWGEKDSDAFHCEYHEKSEWKTSEELDAETNASTGNGVDAKMSKED